MLPAGPYGWLDEGGEDQQKVNKIRQSIINKITIETNKKKKSTSNLNSKYTFYSQNTKKNKSSKILFL